MNLRDEFLAVLDALADAKLDYAICGGFAVAIHGYPRLTQDIDLLVRAEDLDSARGALQRAGYTTAKTATRAKAIFENVNAKVVGAILNRATSGSDGSGYYYLDNDYYNEYRTA